MEQTSTAQTPSSWLDRPILNSISKVRVETLLIAIILILAVVSRFADLGLRTMAFDEINHVIPSWQLANGQGYRHDPMTHGPEQFHLVALVYFLFGDNDFTSRVPSALFSIATVAAALFCFRKYIGRAGSLVAGFLFLVSPYMLFYGRYVRNKSFVALYGVLTLFAILRYLDTGQNRYFLLLTVVSAFQFATKETAYIYTAQAMIFLAFIFMLRSYRFVWPDRKKRDLFTFLLFGALVLVTLSVLLAGYNAIVSKNAGDATTTGLTMIKGLEIFGVAAGAVMGIVALAILIPAIGWKVIKQERSFQLLLLLVSLVLPLLTALGVKLFGSAIGQDWNPIDYSPAGMVHTAIFLVLMTALSVVVGFLWDIKRWLANFTLFYVIFTVFYTTFFTNTSGFFTGIVGSLGYWLSQQGETRGSQPFYYFILVEMPVYEFLAIFGTLLATYFGFRHRKLATYHVDSFAAEALPEEEQSLPDEVLFQPDLAAAAGYETGETLIMPEGEGQAEEETPNVNETLLKRVVPVPALGLFLYWSITSLVAYTFAGEKMPWLTVHIALPCLLAAAWGFGYLIDTTHWEKLKENKSWLVILLLPVFITSMGTLMGSIFGANPPFQGDTLEQLQASSDFVISAVGFLLSGWGILRLMRDWSGSQTARLFVTILAVFLAVLTVRTSYRANYIDEMSGKEYLVYAHSPAGPKDVYNQVVNISERITGGLDLKVAYDNDALYPFWWYFRDFPNKYFYNDVTRDLQDYPVIIAGTNLDKLDSLTKDDYIHYDYKRLVWPNMDYFNLTWDRVWGALKDPQYRAALFDIWINRDYTLYAQLTKSTSFTDSTWEPSEPLRLYIRKDILRKSGTTARYPPPPPPSKPTPTSKP